VGVGEGVEVVDLVDDLGVGYYYRRLRRRRRLVILLVNYYS